MFKVIIFSSLLESQNDGRPQTCPMISFTESQKVRKNDFCPQNMPEAIIFKSINYSKNDFQYIHIQAYHY